MPRPFFSVVIPTKNRSFLIESAVDSVLKQSFTDVEVVIADNDDTEATHDVIKSIQDSRVRYFRTGGLSMPDNWDFVYSKAEGEYILLLEDKQILKEGALEKIYDVIECDYSLVVSWCYDQLRDDKIPSRIKEAGGTGKHFYVSSEEVIETFLNYGRGGMIGRVLPRGLNSCINRKLAEQIRTNTAGHLCLSVSPDYTLAFLQLAFVEKFMHIDEALVTVSGYKYSTGRSFKLKGESAAKVIQEIGRKSILYDRVPIKAPILSNSLLNDYEMVRTLVGGRLLKYPINIHNYFLLCFHDIQESKELGVDVSSEEVEWKRALSEEDKSTRDAVTVAITLFELQRQRVEKFKTKIKERDEKITKLDAKVLSLKEMIQHREEKIQKLEQEVQQQRERADKIKLKLNKMSGKQST